MKNYEIRKLKVYDASYEGERDPISIHTNHKGSLIKLSVDQNINLIGIVDYKVGNPARGNHYHEFKDEYIYLLEGKVNAYFKNVDSPDIDHEVIEKGTLLHIKPGCVHAFTALEDGYAIEYCSNKSKEIENDSYYEIIA